MSRAEEIVIFEKDKKWHKEIIIKINNKDTYLIKENHDKYVNVIVFIRNTLGWIEVNFHGFVPINDYACA